MAMGDKTTAPPPTPLPPVALAGAAEDARLRLATALSREEVIRRRRRRLVQLYSVYRSQYWALADELVAKHSEYWWEHGASPVVDAPPRPAVRHKENGVAAVSIYDEAADGPAVLPAANCGPQPPPPPGNGDVTPAAAAGGRAACSAANCGAKAMPLSPYCFDHILLDPKQHLYKPCAFKTQQSSTPSGMDICGKPVMKGTTTPLRCSDHDPKSQKSILEALRSVGIDLPLTSKSVPKLSVLISETVRQIQMKRKQSLNDVKTRPSHRSFK